MSKLPYLVQEINAGLEIYLSGRTGQQYNRTSFILCDDYAELACKLFLLTDNPGWSDKGAKKPFKSFRDVTGEVRDVFRAKRATEFVAIDGLLNRIESRRERRNAFFHSTHLLDLNFHARDCVEAFTDLLDCGALLFPNDWDAVVSVTGNMDTCEVLLRLDKKAYGDPGVTPRLNNILGKWPRLGPPPRKQGCEVAHHAEDLHLRLCIRNGGKDLRDRLRSLL